MIKSWLVLVFEHNFLKIMILQIVGPEGGKFTEFSGLGDIGRKPKPETEMGGALAGSGKARGGSCVAGISVDEWDTIILMIVF